MSTFSGGNGTEFDPYLIATAEDLVNVGIENKINPEQFYKQIANIDLSGIVNWSPIGDVSEGPPFLGSYDGGGFDIIDPTRLTSPSANFGLFGVCNGAILSNINIVNPRFEFVGSYTPSGVLSGVLSSSTVTRCSVKGGKLQNGNSSGFAFVISDSIISQCYVADIELIVDGAASLFSFSVGDNNLITDCWASGKMIPGINPGNVSGFVFEVGEGSNIINCLAVPDMLTFTPENSEFVRLSLFVNASNLEGDILNSYADSSTTESIIWSMWDNTPDSPEGRTATELAEIGTYEGWDFENVWKMVNGQVVLQIMPDPESPTPTIPTLQAEFFTKIGDNWFRLVN